MANLDSRLKEAFQARQKEEDAFRMIEEIVDDEWTQDPKFLKPFYLKFVDFLEKQIRRQNNHRLSLLLQIVAKMAQFPSMSGRRKSGLTKFIDYGLVGALSRCHTALRETDQIGEKGEMMSNLLGAFVVIEKYSLEGAIQVLFSYIPSLVENLCGCPVKNYAITRKEVRAGVYIVKAAPNQSLIRRLQREANVREFMHPLTKELPHFGDIDLQAALVILILRLLQDTEAAKSVARCFPNASLSAKFFAMVAETTNAEEKRDPMLLEFLTELNAMQAKPTVFSANAYKIKIDSGESSNIFSDVPVHFNYGSKSIRMCLQEQPAERQLKPIECSSVQFIRSKKKVVSGRHFREFWMKLPSEDEEEQSIAFLFRRDLPLAEIGTMFDDIQGDGILSSPVGRPSDESSATLSNPSRARSSLSRGNSSNGKWPRSSTPQDDVDVGKDRPSSLSTIGSKVEPTSVPSSQPGVDNSPPVAMATPVAAVRGRRQGHPSPSLVESPSGQLSQRRAKRMKHDDKENAPAGEPVPRKKRRLLPLKPKQLLSDDSCYEPGELSRMKLGSSAGETTVATETSVGGKKNSLEKSKLVASEEKRKSSAKKRKLSLSLKQKADSAVQRSAEKKKALEAEYVEIPEIPVAREEEVRDEKELQLSPAPVNRSEEESGPYLDAIPYVQDDSSEDVPPMDSTSIVIPFRDVPATSEPSLCFTPNVNEWNDQASTRPETPAVPPHPSLPGPSAPVSSPPDIFRALLDSIMKIQESRAADCRSAAPSSIGRSRFDGEDCESEAEARTILLSRLNISRNSLKHVTHENNSPSESGPIRSPVTHEKDSPSESGPIRSPRSESNSQCSSATKPVSQWGSTAAFSPDWDASWFANDKEVRDSQRKPTRVRAAEKRASREEHLHSVQERLKMVGEQVIKAVKEAIRQAGRDLQCQW